MVKTVYLAGTIGGLTYEECTGWRNHADVRLREGSLHKVEGRDPMRMKQFLNRMTVINGTGEGYPEDNEVWQQLASSRGVLARDHNDVVNADVVLMNLYGAEKVSIGTMIELGIAYTRQIPIVLVMEPGNIHEHLMVEAAYAYRFTDLDSAIDVTLGILLG